MLLRMIVMIVLGLGFMLLSSWAASWLFEQYRALGNLAPRLIERTLALLLLFFTSLLTFHSALSAFSSFYMAEDLPLLMVAPVPFGRLFLARLLITWMQSSWMMIVFALPILCISGPAIEAPFGFYAALIVGFLLMTLTCTALGTCGALLLSRVFPAKRNREAFIALSAVLFLSGYLAVCSSSLSDYLNADGFAKWVELLSRLKPSEVGKHPAGWLLGMLFSGIAGDFGKAVLNGCLLLLGTAGSMLLGMWIAKSTWRRSFSLYLEGAKTSKSGHSGRTGRSTKSNSKPQSIVWALICRDTRIFFRSPGQWSQLLFVGALLIVYVINFKHFELLSRSGILKANGLLIVNLLLGTMVVAVLAARFLYPSVSLEGAAYWLCLSAPLEAETLLKAKVLWGIGPLTLACLGINVASNLMVHLPLCDLLGSAFLTLLCVFSLSGLAVGMGACDARFDEPNPAKLATSFGAVLFMLSSLVVVSVLTALFAPGFLMIRRFMELQTLPDGQNIFWRVALFCAALLLAFFIHVVPLKLGARALRRHKI